MFDTWQDCIIIGTALGLTAIIFYFYGKACERVKNNRPD